MANNVDLVHENLRQCELAVDYVKRKMTIGAGNKFSDLLSSILAPEWSMTCVARIRSEPYTGDTVIGKLRTIAQRAADAGCGNCGEQAAIAFTYLLDKKVKKIDYMSHLNMDHAFVVVGRIGPIDKPKEWGNECYICDPWDGKAYSISDVSKKMYGNADFAAKSVAQWEG